MLSKKYYIKKPTEKEPRLEIAGTIQVSGDIKLFDWYMNLTKTGEEKYG